MDDELIEFEVRVGSDTHRALAELAAHKNVDLNDLVVEALTDELHRARGINQLPSCPFCGGDAQDDFIAGQSYLIECYTCGAQTGIKDSEDEAIAAWSRRTEIEGAR